MPLEKNISNNIKGKKKKISKNKIFIILMVVGCMMGSFSHTAFSSIFELIMRHHNDIICFSNKKYQQESVISRCNVCIWEWGIIYCDKF